MIQRDSTTRSSVEGTRAPARARRAIAGIWGVGLLVAGWAAMLLVPVVATAFAVADSAGALIGTGATVLLSLAGIGGGTVIVLRAAHSETRHVFSARPVFVTGTLLVSSGVIVFVALMSRQPFDRFAADGTITAITIADLGCLAIAMFSLAAGGIALLDSWDARDEERSWGRLE
ncbi:MAG: hypothetical protein HKN44_02165 [Ilumatobacter sp.]|nr:hypothetical protein [Ilumatobacter sp.]